MPTSAPTAATRSACVSQAVTGRGEVFYIPGCARIDAALRARLADARCLLFDGTVYTDDEMIAAGVGAEDRRAHGPPGDVGSGTARSPVLPDVKIGRRIFVHINNTNPVLDENSRRACGGADGGLGGRL